jgi:hypothetical protein
VCNGWFMEFLFLFAPTYRLGSPTDMNDWGAHRKARIATARRS